jgi:uroporphyrinogen decarboxylase
MTATVLEKPTQHNSMNADPVDAIELCKRTGCSGTGFGIYYSPCRSDHRLQTTDGFREVRREGPPDFTHSLDRIKRLQDATAGTDIGVWVYTHGPLDPIYMGMDLQEFWILTIDNPNHLYAVGDYLLDINTGLTEIIASCGVDWLLVGDDVAFKNGLMVPPAFFFDYYPPRIRQLIAPAKQSGLTIIYHSDGKIDSIVEMLIECGFDSLHPIEPYSNDIVEIASIAGGRIGLVGNIELATSSPQEVYQRTRTLIETLGARYVPASSHSVTNDVKPETYAAFLRAIHEER